MIPARSPIAEPASLRRIAEQEFARRRASLAEALAAGQTTRGFANANAQLWLAIAAHVGAALPELELATLWPIGGKRFQRAEDIADPADYRAEAARARNVAIDKAESAPANLALEQRARDWIALAEAIGAPGIDWRGPPPSSSAAVGQQANSIERKAA